MNDPESGKQDTGYLAFNGIRITQISNRHSIGQVVIRKWWHSNDNSNSKAVRSDDTTPASHRERTREKEAIEVLQCPA